jgi:hypothetical protein
MLSDNKLEYVKRCCNVIVDILNEQDHLSIITFGDNAAVCLNRVPVNTSNKEHIRSVITGLEPDGCTNMSAGLLEVRTVLEGDSQKAGLLLLTDGLANRGITNPNSLVDITETLRKDFSHLSVHTVGYGTDHNADLLKSIAVQSQGSYNIVNSLEDTAVAFGDVLGGLMSCAYQNVQVMMHSDAKLYGPYKNFGGGVSLGDVYSGTTPILLFDMKKADFEASVIRLKWTSCTDYKITMQDAVWTTLEERDKDIDLCFLRYECSDIMKDLSNAVPGSLSGEGYDTMSSRIQKFEDKLRDSFLTDSSLTALLLSEVSVLREMFTNIVHNRQTQRGSTLLIQHSACLGLGRGFSSPMGRMGSDPSNVVSPRGNALRRQVGGVLGPVGGPAGGPVGGPAGSPLEDPTTFQNNIQRDISGGLRTATQSYNYL